MKKLLLSFIMLAIMGLSNVFAQQKIFYLKGKTSPYNIYSANLDGTGEVLIATGALDAGYGGGKICFYTDYTDCHRLNLSESVDKLLFYPCSFAQESRKVTVRLNTSFPPG